MKLLHIERIVFTDGSTLSDKNAAITSGFLVVESDDQDMAATWFNLNEVAVLEGVGIQQSKGRVTAF